MGYIKYAKFPKYCKADKTNLNLRSFALPLWPLSIDDGKKKHKQKQETEGV